MLSRNALKTAAVPILLATGAQAAPSAGCGSQGLESGVHTLNINGVDRQFTLTIPDGYDANNPYRLILGVHWWGGTMEDVATGQTVEAGVFNYYGLERLAEGSAIFAAPQGIGGNWYNEGGADFAFIDQLIGTVEDALCVDTDLRFFIGFSWGGAMSYGLACRDTEYPLRAITAIGAAGPIECKSVDETGGPYTDSHRLPWNGPHRVLGNPWHRRRTGQRTRNARQVHRQQRLRWRGEPRARFGQPQPRQVRVHLRRPSCGLDYLCESSPFPPGLYVC